MSAIAGGNITDGGPSTGGGGIAGVSAFNGRTGAVIPLKSDYSAFYSSAKEVSDPAVILLLENEANWSGNVYTGTPIVTQGPGDFYINTTHDYKFFTLSGSVTARRIPYKYL